MIPTGTATSVPIRKAASASCSVAGARDSTSGRVGVFCAIDVPRSPRSSPPRKMTYWTGQRPVQPEIATHRLDKLPVGGVSKQHLGRIARVSRSSRKITTDTASSTKTVCRSRRATYLDKGRYPAQVTSRKLSIRVGSTGGLGMFLWWTIGHEPWNRYRIGGLFQSCCWICL